MGSQVWYLDFRRGRARGTQQRTRNKHRLFPRLNSECITYPESHVCNDRILSTEQADLSSRVLAGWEEEANARLFCRVDLLPEFQPKFVRWTGYIGLQTCWYEIDNGSDLEHNQSWPSGTFYGSSYETFRTMNPLGSGKLKGVALNVSQTIIRPCFRPSQLTLIYR